MATWREICENGHEFKDGSIITQVHETHQEECYKLFLLEGKSKNVKEVVLSEEHLILCNLDNINKKLKMQALSLSPQLIPLKEDIHFLKNKEGIIHEFPVYVESESNHKKDNLYWLNIKSINFLTSLRKTVKPVTSNKHSIKIKECLWIGKKSCFCVSTDTGNYDVCGLIHHNSVTLRNVIFHSFTHGDDIKLALIDLKRSEFERYKGMKDCVGVANTVAEAAELLRLCREIMYMRNKENAERGLTDFKDWNPQNPTSKIKIFGREFDENEMFHVKVNEEEKELSAKDLLQLVENTL